MFFGWSNSRILLIARETCQLRQLFGRVLTWMHKCSKWAHLKLVSYAEAPVGYMGEGLTSCWQVQSIPQWPGYKYCLDPVIMTNDHLLKFLYSHYLCSFAPIIPPVQLPFDDRWQARSNHVDIHNTFCWESIIKKALMLLSITEFWKIMVTLFL